MARKSRALARLIQKTSGKVIQKTKPLKAKKAPFFIEKEGEGLGKKAQEYDDLVRSLLEKQVKSDDKVLIFSYQDGFVFSDLDSFGKYSIKL